MTAPCPVSVLVLLLLLMLFPPCTVLPFLPFLLSLPSLHHLWREERAPFPAFPLPLLQEKMDIWVTAHLMGGMKRISPSPLTGHRNLTPVPPCPPPPCSWILPTHLPKMMLTPLLVSSSVPWLPVLMEGEGRGIT